MSTTKTLTAAAYVELMHHVTTAMYAAGWQALLDKGLVTGPQPDSLLKTMNNYGIDDRLLALSVMDPAGVSHDEVEDEPERLVIRMPRAEREALPLPEPDPERTLAFFKRRT